MKINELEQMLKVSKANIRFYESEGLISPNRKDNGYRDYCNEDIAVLKRIIVLRKIGLSISDIKKVFSNELSLKEAISCNIKNLEEQISELNGALSLSKKIVEEPIDIENFNQEKYYELLCDEENQGNKFNEIFNDYLNFETNIFFKMWKNIFFINLEKVKSKVGVFWFVVILFIICIVRGLSGKFLWNNRTFFQGFIYPFEIFIIASLIMLPIYFLSKTKPKAGKVLVTITLCLCYLFLAVVICALLIGIILGIVNKFQ